METIIGTEIVKINGTEVRLGHTWHEVDVIKGIIDIENPDFFFEIGVHEGALSRELILYAKQKLTYVGIELNCSIIHPIVQPFYSLPRTILICGDCFSLDVIERIGNMLGKKIIYCDGGLKKEELKTYAPLLLVGDVLLSHDFSDGTRHGWGLPEEIRNEVSVEDIQFLEDDPTFEHLSGHDFEGTRIIGYKKL